MAEQKEEAVHAEVDAVLADAEAAVEEPKEKPTAKKKASTKKKPAAEKKTAEKAEPEAEAAEAVPSNVLMPQLDNEGNLFPAYLMKRRLIPQVSPSDGAENIHEVEACMYISEVIFPHYNLQGVSLAQSGQNGNDVLWQFVRPPEGEKPKHKEIKHFFRSVGLNPRTTVTGFQANETISDYLREGWTLFHFESFGADMDGSFCMWVLVR